MYQFSLARGWELGGERKRHWDHGSLWKVRWVWIRWLSWACQPDRWGLKGTRMSRLFFLLWLQTLLPSYPAWALGSSHAELGRLSCPLVLCPLGHSVHTTVSTLRCLLVHLPVSPFRLKPFFIYALNAWKIESLINLWWLLWNWVDR